MEKEHIRKLKKMANADDAEALCELGIEYHTGEHLSTGFS